jgi:hypothetical protein
MVSGFSALVGGSAKTVNHKGAGQVHRYFLTAREPSDVGLRPDTDPFSPFDVGLQLPSTSWMGEHAPQKDGD